jgi:hypothetical protein
MNIKQRWLRYIANQKTVTQEVVSTDPIEQKGANIFLSMLKEPHSVLSVAPLSGEKMINNPERKMLIILSYNNLTIINSVYQYEIRMKESLVQKLIMHFDDTQERRANIIKRRAYKTVRQSLDLIDTELKTSNLKVDLS